MFMPHCFCRQIQTRGNRKARPWRGRKSKPPPAKPETGWQADTNGLTDVHAALFLPADPIAVKSNGTLVARLKFEASTSKRAIGHFRLSAAQDEQLVQLLNPPKTDPWQVVGPFKTENTQQG